MQVIQDELLLQEIETCRTLDNNQIPPSLEHFQRFVVDLKPDANVNDKSSALYMAIGLCTRDINHYARVSGCHVLECIMNTALSAVKRELLQEASNVCVLFKLCMSMQFFIFATIQRSHFGMKCCSMSTSNLIKPQLSETWQILMLYPRLQPLVAAMGWDLLSGKTTERRKLMQLLWTTKSQVYRLEESSLYGNQSDEVIHILFSIIVKVQSFLVLYGCICKECLK